MGRIHVLNFLPGTVETGAFKILQDGSAQNIPMDRLKIRLRVEGEPLLQFLQIALVTLAVHAGQILQLIAEGVSRWLRAGAGSGFFCGGDHRAAVLFGHCLRAEKFSFFVQQNFQLCLLQDVPHRAKGGPGLEDLSRSGKVRLVGFAGFLHQSHSACPPCPLHSSSPEKLFCSLLKERMPIGRTRLWSGQSSGRGNSITPYRMTGRQKLTVR